MTLEQERSRNPNTWAQLGLDDPIGLFQPEWFWELFHHRKVKEPPALSLREQSWGWFVWSSSGEEERAPLGAEGRIILNFGECRVRAQVQLD